MSHSDSKSLHPSLDYLDELKSTLQLLLTEAPPSAFHHAKFGGLYHGPRSIALTLFRLSQIYSSTPIVFENVSLQDWARRYLSLPIPSRKLVTPTADHCGIINECLVSFALHALIDGDETAIRDLCNQPQLLDPNPMASDEWLYGRAGYLYLLRLVMSISPPPSTESLDLVRATTERVVSTILQTDTWIWHGKEYYGPAHGTIGIITQILLSSPSHLPSVRTKLITLLETQMPDGNFESSAGSSGRGRLVQFCHGAPGFVVSLESIREVVLNISETDLELLELIDRVLKKAREVIWSRGALVKEPCLCHGIAGNLLGLSDPEKIDYFLSLMTESQIKKAKYEPSDDPYSLYSGMAGRAWVWAVMDRHLQKTCLGFNDL
jgi:hypothetical protein